MDQPLPVAGESGKSLADAIDLLKARPDWQRADAVASVNAQLRIAAIAAFSRDEDREDAVLEVLNAKAEPFLRLVEDEATRDAYLCLAVMCARSASAKVLIEASDARLPLRWPGQGGRWFDSSGPVRLS